MPADTWFSRDLPVLEAVVELLDNELIAIDPTRLAGPTGLDQQNITRALVALDGPYVEMTWLNVAGGIGRIQGVTPAARQATGQWPTGESLADSVLETLDARIDAAPTPEERSRWVKLRDGVAGAGRDVLVEVMAAVVSRQMAGG